MDAFFNRFAVNLICSVFNIKNARNGLLRRGRFAFDGLGDDSGHDTRADRFTTFSDSKMITVADRNRLLQRDA